VKHLIGWKKRAAAFTNFENFACAVAIINGALSAHGRPLFHSGGRLF
jgi:hypothetical protein